MEGVTLKRRGWFNGFCRDLMGSVSELIMSLLSQIEAIGLLTSHSDPVLDDSLWRIHWNSLGIFGSLLLYSTCGGSRTGQLCVRLEGCVWGGVRALGRGVGYKGSKVRPPVGNEGSCARVNAEVVTSQGCPSLTRWPAARSPLQVPGEFRSHHEKDSQHQTFRAAEPH